MKLANVEKVVEVMLIVISLLLVSVLNAKIHVTAKLAVPMLNVIQSIMMPYVDAQRAFPVMLSDSVQLKRKIVPLMVIVVRAVFGKLSKLIFLILY